MGRPVIGVASWVLTALVVLGVAVRLGGWDRGRVLVQGMAFYPYALGAAAVLAVMVWLVRQPRPAAVLTVAVVVGVLPLVPRLVAGDGAGAATGGGAAVRVGTLNLLYGRADPVEVRGIATGVDVLALQELTPEALDALEDVGLGDVLPHRAVDLRDGPGGTGVWSRYPLDAREAVPSRYATVHVAVDHPLAADPVEVVAVHVVPPSGGDVGAWQEELARLTALDRVDVLLGDFNATLDHVAFRRRVGAGYVDVGDAAGRGPTPTWPAEGFRLPGIAIDHVLVDGGWRPAGMQVVDVPGTDHRALIADVVPPGQA